MVVSGAAPAAVVALGEGSVVMIEDRVGVGSRLVDVDVDVEGMKGVRELDELGRSVGVDVLDVLVDVDVDVDVDVGVDVVGVGVDLDVLEIEVEIGIEVVF